MTNPLVQAFFVGRAVAEVMTEHLENALTDALSEVGKLDAELREQLRQFTNEVMERANRAADVADTGESATGFGQTATNPVDLQAIIDELRAEIAFLRTELQRYRSSRNS
jgi:demethoxyubiquinone hydroxylase (CLK1/Coq7/Cat5 family)